MQGIPNGARSSETVGRVVALWRYPIKSMAAEALTEVEVGWHGLAGDRRWAFVQDGNPHSGFPWLTLRERADMAHYQPRFADPARPDKSATLVRTPSGTSFDVTDPALAAELCPTGARVLRQDRGVFDTFPLSLISTQTLARLGDMVGSTMDAQRFRPNLLVQLADDTPFAEDAWVGRTLRVGTLRLRVDKRDGRCMVVNLDPMTAQRNPAVLRTVADERQGCLGVYGSTVEPGRIAVGDGVFVEG